MKITAAEMKYMRKTAGHIWTDYKTNAHIAKELKITPILGGGGGENLEIKGRGEKKIKENQGK